MKIITTNKKANFDYFFIDNVEAGLVLTGAEVKSIKLGHVTLADSFCFIRSGEAWLKNCFVAGYVKGSNFNPEERRDRKLLMHKAEIARLVGKIQQKGYTLVPRQMYFKDNYIKVQLGIAEGKKQHDKRETIKERDLKRDMDRQIKNIR